QKLYRRMDLREEAKYLGLYKEFYGSLAYSWDECVRINGTQQYPPGTLPESQVNCVHFIQLNNYPTYRTSFDAVVTNKWNIQPSMDWLRIDLEANKNRPIIINLHDFDNYFTPEGKSQLQQLLNNPNYRILAIFFAHIHHRIGLHDLNHWCFNGKPVPLLYSGS